MPTLKTDRPAPARPASPAATAAAAPGSTWADATARSTLWQRLQQLPRAARWAIFGGAAVLTLVVYSDYVLGTASAWNLAAQEREQALHKARAVADSESAVKQLRRVIEAVGPVEMPGDEAEASARLKEAVNDVIKSHKEVTKDSFQTGSPGKLKRGTMEEITDGGEARYVAATVEFEAPVEVAMQVIAELEGRPEIEAISSLRLNRPSSKSELQKINVRMQVEAWVISSEGPARGTSR